MTARSVLTFGLGALFTCAVQLTTDLIVGRSPMNR